VGVPRRKKSYGEHAKLAMTDPKKRANREEDGSPETFTEAGTKIKTCHPRDKGSGGKGKIKDVPLL